jgi:hypothetical protein
MEAFERVHIQIHEVYFQGTCWFSIVAQTFDGLKALDSMLALSADDLLSGHYNGMVKNFFANGVLGIAIALDYEGSQV